MAISSEHAFIDGEKTINSIQLIPHADITRGEETTIRIIFPKNLPLGDHHIIFIQPEETEKVFYNSLKVVLPPPSKPAFTMEDFERILKERLR